MARRGAAAARGTWRPRKRKPSHAPADVDNAGDFDGDAAEGGRAPRKGRRTTAAAGGGFFCCYLLRSLCPRSKGRTYIGFTVNPRRRIRQHNGEISSGAWKTRRGRPWEMVLCIYGFPSNVAALQFEWAWQHPTESHAVREAAAEFKSGWSVGKMVKLAYTMLNLPSWEHLNLTVNFFSSKNTKFAAGCPPLPSHMKTVVCAMEDLLYQADRPSSEEDGNGIREEELADNEDGELSDWPILDGYSYPDHCFQQPSSDDDQVQPIDEQTRTAGFDVEDDLADEFFAPTVEWSKILDTRELNGPRTSPLCSLSPCGGDDVGLEQGTGLMSPSVEWSEILETRRELKGPTTSPLCSLSPCIDDAGLDKGTGLMSPLLMPNASSDGGDACHILDGNHVVDLVTPTPVGRLRRRDCVSSICPKIIDLTSSPIVIQL